jgi:hypothetical protein
MKTPEDNSIDTLSTFACQIIGTMGCMSYLITLVCLSFKYGAFDDYDGVTYQSPAVMQMLMIQAIPFALPATVFGMALLYVKSKTALAINMCTNIGLIYFALFVAVVS